MNKELSTFAREYLKYGLSKLSERHHNLFRRMYGLKRPLDTDINIIVDLMPDSKLDIAMTQVRQTLKKHFVEDKIFDIKERPREHVHTFEELQTCCTHNGVVDLSIINAHDQYGV